MKHHAEQTTSTRADACMGIQIDRRICVYLPWLSLIFIFLSGRPFWWWMLLFSIHISSSKSFLFFFARICFLLMVLYCLFSSEIVLLRLPAIFQCAHLLRNHNDQNDDECLVYLYSTFWWHTFLSFQYQLGEFDGYASSYFNFKPFHFIQSTNCAVLFIWLTTKSVEIIFSSQYSLYLCFQMFLYARICYCDFITWIKWKCKNFHDNLNITIIMRRFELFINFNIKYIYFFSV